MKFSYLLLPAIAFTCLFSPSQASARQEIDSSDRLAFLNRATGNDSSDNSFQRRVDAIMSTDASANRDFVSTRDEQARLETQKQLLEEKEAEMIRLNPPSSPKSNEEIPKIGGKIEPDLFSDGMDRKMQDASNQAFNQTTSDIYKNMDEKKKMADMLQAGSAQTEETSNTGNELPSLANNPFYSGPGSEASEEQQRFEANKNIIIQRMVSTRGFEESDARRVVRNASSREELMINLMKEGYTYGESTDLSDTGQ